MPNQVEVLTQTNEETDMVHITKLSVPGALHQAFCGYDTRTQKPSVRLIDPVSELTCTTCLEIYLRRNPDALDEELIEEISQQETEQTIAQE